MLADIEMLFINSQNNELIKLRDTLCVMESNYIMHKAQMEETIERLTQIVFNLENRVSSQDETIQNLTDTVRFLQR